MVTDSMKLTLSLQSCEVAINDQALHFETKCTHFISIISCNYFLLLMFYTVFSLCPLVCKTNKKVRKTKVWIDHPSKQINKQSLIK